MGLSKNLPSWRNRPKVAVLAVKPPGKRGAARNRRNMLKACRRTHLEIVYTWSVMADIRPDAFVVSRSDAENRWPPESPPFVDRPPECSGIGAAADCHGGAVGRD